MTSEKISRTLAERLEITPENTPLYVAIHGFRKVYFDQAMGDSFYNSKKTSATEMVSFLTEDDLDSTFKIRDYLSSYDIRYSEGKTMRTIETLLTAEQIHELSAQSYVRRISAPKTTKATLSPDK